MTGHDEKHAAENARADRLADWAESDDLEIADSASFVTDDDPVAESLLRQAFGDAELTRLRGRPALDGSSGSGASPRRQVRLSRQLDEALAARAAAEHRQPSAVIRDAIAAYLRAS